MTSDNPSLDAIMRWLDSHINYEKTGPDPATPPHRNPQHRLDALRSFMELMDNPQHAYPTVHITGTNGKTSTSRMITSLFMAQGLRTGTMTSPHLERLNERIAVNGEPISDDDLAEVLQALQLLEPLHADESLSFFEMMTAAGYRHFADAPIEVGVIEVGMGGEFDATNIIDATVAVVTNVGLDHMNYLGPNRYAIAKHKAGIVKEHSALVLSEPDPELEHLFGQRTAMGPRYWIDRDYGARNDRTAVGGRVVDLFTPNAAYEDVFIALHGRHQSVNAAGALMAAEAFFQQPLHEDVVRQAFAAVTSPGRLEVVGRRPLCVLDGAHNVDGAASLVRSLDEEFAVDGQRIFVVGFLHPHDPAEMLEALHVNGARMVIACTPDSPRAVPANDVVEIAKPLGVPVVAVDDPAEALAQARATADEDDLIVVTGSLYVVGAARQSLDLRSRPSTGE